MQGAESKYLTFFQISFLNFEVDFFLNFELGFNVVVKPRVSGKFQVVKSRICPVLLSSLLFLSSTLSILHQLSILRQLSIRAYTATIKPLLNPTWLPKHNIQLIRSIHLYSKATSPLKPPYHKPHPQFVAFLATAKLKEISLIINLIQIAPFRTQRGQHTQLSFLLQLFVEISLYRAIVILEAPTFDGRQDPRDVHQLDTSYILILILQW